jgi:hypothetical protein
MIPGSDQEGTRTGNFVGITAPFASVRSHLRRQIDKGPWAAAHLTQLFQACHDIQVGRMIAICIGIGLSVRGDDQPLTADALNALILSQYPH